MKRVRAKDETRRSLLHGLRSARAQPLRWDCSRVSGRQTDPIPKVPPPTGALAKRTHSHLKGSGRTSGRRRPNPQVPPGQACSVWSTPNGGAPRGPEHPEGPEREGPEPAGPEPAAEPAGPAPSGPGSADPGPAAPVPTGPECPQGQECPAGPERPGGSEAREVWTAQPPPGSARNAHHSRDRGAARLPVRSRKRSFWAKPFRSGPNQTSACLVDRGGT